ncbi:MULTISPECIES: response regulator transcription factor [unclassified Cryobacterium]|uniref:response regulator transcription factor n=1 Tax=unclassified Cryobacterium TaxID=2649013 RepID=UPI002AB56A62|nr:MULTISPECIES: response regulator transcription factor [unclassified Cryobacterium]MDY7544168.1 response regulator transcription factor [Cryobacterium sp. 5B3]MEA9997745.1 response regulator transcription factor [Cryobacterium sp. RTS3]MEB0266914.1 response regulator transcription factor [Cryobacterium sp. 10I5]MEB0276342.1 response regulator transcription factor [Cryobacterium sp. 5B3]
MTSTEQTSAESAAPLRLVLAEDSLLLREGLVRLFDEAGFDCVAAYGDADGLLADVDRLRPDVAVLDVRMPPTFRDEGVRAALELRRRLPGVGILLLSQYVEATYAHELLAAGDGGLGYLLKDRVASLEELQDAVLRIHAGGTVLDPQVVRELLSRRTDPLEHLTPRERDVLGLMAEGRTNVSIASRLVIGVGAVEKNVTAIFQKLGLDDSGTDHRRVLAVLAFLRH